MNALDTVFDLENREPIARPCRALLTKTCVQASEVGTRIVAICQTGLLPKRHKLPGVPVAHTTTRTHNGKDNSPNRYGGQMALPAYQRAANPRWIQPSEPFRSRRTVQQLDHH